LGNVVSPDRSSDLSSSTLRGSLRGRFFVDIGRGRRRF
jgi:hypothetical protein